MENLVKGKFEVNLGMVIKMLKENEFVRDHINMKSYQKGVARGKDIMHECNTTGCVLGHALRLLSDDDFYELQEFTKKPHLPFYDIFSEDYFGAITRDESWSFLFGSDWSNNPQETISRIEYYLDKNMKMDKVIGAETGDHDYSYAKTTIDFKDVKNK